MDFPTISFTDSVSCAKIHVGYGKKTVQNETTKTSFAAYLREAGMKLCRIFLRFLARQRLEHEIAAYEIR